MAPDETFSENPGPWSVSRRRALQLTGGLAAAATSAGTSTAVAAGPATVPVEVTGHRAVLTEGTNFTVAVSPDGEWLAFDLATAIWVLPARGGRARRLTDDLQDATRPRWSPDGGTLAFQSYRDGSFHLWTIHPDGSGLRQLTTGRYDHREPHFTPDGRAIVFSSDRGGAGRYGIHRLDLATGSIAALTDGTTEDAEPAVSADGTRVVFTVDARSIDELHLGTGRRRAVVPARTGSSVYGPAYSPGDALGYVRVSGHVADLVIEDRNVTTGRDVFAVPPSWASGTELYYTADGSVVRHRIGGGHDPVPFTATVPVTSRRPQWLHRVCCES